MLSFIFPVASAVYSVLLQMSIFLQATEGTCLLVGTSGVVIVDYDYNCIIIFRVNIVFSCKFQFIFVKFNILPDYYFHSSS